MKIICILRFRFKRIYPNSSGILTNTFYFGDQEPMNEKTAELYQTYNITKHDATVLLVLEPGKSIDININFNATSALTKSTLLYIRNNLTVLEVVRLVGHGAYPQLKFGSRKPGSISPLTFELSDKLLKECEKERKPNTPLPKLFVKRLFQAKNVGDVSIYIRGFYINGYPCEGYGYKVINCEPFNLLPNETRKVEVVFTPDFTLAKVQRMLILDTTLNVKANFTLLTTVPPYYLSLCSNLIERPSWEYLMYKYSIGLMCCMLICVLIAAFLESDRIIRTTVQILSRDAFVMQAPLDLRLIGAKANKVECQMEKIEDVKKPVKSWNDTGKNRTKNLFGVNNGVVTGAPPPACVKSNNKKNKVVKKNSVEIINNEVGKKSPINGEKVGRVKKCISPVGSKVQTESPVVKKISPVVTVETVIGKVNQVKKPLPKKQVRFGF